MRFDDQVVYPHPVLRDGVSDYASGEFFDDLHAMAPDGLDDPLSIRVNYHLKEPTLEQLVNEGKAVVQLHVSCRETFYSELVRVPRKGASIAIDPRKVHGSLKLIMVICATEDIEDFSSAGFSDDFKDMSFNVPAGDFLAFCQPRILYLEREAFGTAESVIELVQSSDLPGNYWVLDADTDRLAIMIDEGTMQDIARVRNDRLGKAALIASIYSSAVQQAVEILKETGGDDLLWKRVIRQRCTFLGISPETEDSSTVAQLVLGSPLEKVLKLMTETDDAN